MEFVWGGGRGREIIFHFLARELNGGKTIDMEEYLSHMSRLYLGNARAGRKFVIDGLHEEPVSCKRVTSRKRTDISL